VLPPGEKRGKTSPLEKKEKLSRGKKESGERKKKKQPSTHRRYFGKGVISLGGGGRPQEEERRETSKTAWWELRSTGDSYLVPTREGKRKRKGIYGKGGRIEKERKPLFTFGGRGSRGDGKILKGWYKFDQHLKGALRGGETSIKEYSVRGRGRVYEPRCYVRSGIVSIGKQGLAKGRFLGGWPSGHEN